MCYTRSWPVPQGSTPALLLETPLFRPLGQQLSRCIQRPWVLPLCSTIWLLPGPFHHSLLPGEAFAAPDLQPVPSERCARLSAPAPSVQSGQSVAWCFAGAARRVAVQVPPTEPVQEARQDGGSQSGLGTVPGHRPRLCHRSVLLLRTPAQGECGPCAGPSSHKRLSSLPGGASRSWRGRGRALQRHGQSHCSREARDALVRPESCGWSAGQ